MINPCVSSSLRTIFHYKFRVYTIPNERWVGSIKMYSPFSVIICIHLYSPCGISKKMSDEYNISGVYPVVSWIQPAFCTFHNRSRSVYTIPTCNGYVTHYTPITPSSTVQIVQSHRGACVVNNINIYMFFFFHKTRVRP